MLLLVSGSLCNQDVAGLSTRIFSSFRMAISLLRELMPHVVDVVRVVSSFIGKLSCDPAGELLLKYFDDRL